MIGYVTIILANFMAMFLISGIGVLGYAVAGEYDAVLSVSMIFTLESAVRCAVMPISGKLGEKFGRKQLFVFALILYTLSYAVATFVPGFWVYVIARTVSGAAWALWVTNSFVLMNDVFGNQDATKLTGFAQTVSTIGMMIAAPLAGIFCATQTGWRLEYYIALPILVIVIILAIIGVPKSEKSKNDKPMDIGGSFATILFLIPFALVMSWGPANGWTTPLNIGLIVLAVVGAVLLIVFEKKSQDPIFPVRVLSNKFYLSIFMVSLFFSIANAAFNYLPTYVQYYCGVDAVKAGFFDNTVSDCCSNRNNPSRKLRIQDTEVPSACYDLGSSQCRWWYVIVDDRYAKTRSNRIYLGRDQYFPNGISKWMSAGGTIYLSAERTETGRNCKWYGFHRRIRCIW